MVESLPEPPDWDDKPLSETDADAASREDRGVGLPKASSSRSGLIWVALAAVLAGVLGYFFVNRGERRPSSPVEQSIPQVGEEPGSPEPSPLPALDAPETVELPRLSQSDPFVRQTLTGALSAPLVSAWASQPELVRTFVGAVDNIANGSHPGKQLGFLKPDARFVATKRSGEVFMGPDSYARFDAMAAVVASVPPETVLSIYRRLEPLLEQAYKELGYGAPHTFEDTLKRAIDQVLAVPVVEGPIRLTPRFSSYQYQDPTLAKLSDAQKLFLRMGPENLRSIQSLLRECRSQL